MTTLNMIHTITTTGAKVYAVAGELFTITTMMWCLSMMSNMIEKCYAAGIIAGEFYKTHLDDHARNAVIAIIAFIILTGQLAYEGAQLLYNNREEIGYNIATGWNRLERSFTYESPVMTV